MTDRFAALRNLPRLQLTTPQLIDDPPVPKHTPTAPKPTKCKPNESCLCGSHIKYKKCCMNKDLNQAREKPLAKMQEMMRTNKTLAATVRQMAESLKKA